MASAVKDTHLSVHLCNVYDLAIGILYQRVCGRMPRSGSIFLFVLLAAAVVGISNADIISVTPLETVVTDVITGVTTNFLNTTVTLSCGSSQPSTFFRDVTSTPRYVILTCNPTQYIFTTVAKGTVPADTAISITKVQPSQNPAADSPAIALSGQDPFSGRRLLSMRHNRQLKGIFTFLSNVVSFATCLWNTPGCGTGGGGATDTTDWQAQLKSLSKFQQDVNALSQTFSQANANQQRINQNVNTTLVNLGMAISGISLRQDAQDAATDALAKSVDEANLLTAQRISQAVELTQAGLRASSYYTDEQVFELQQQMNSSFSAVHAYTMQVFADLYNNLRNGAARTDLVEAFARGIATTAYTGAAGINREVDRALRKFMWVSIQGLQLDGYTLFVDPSVAGSPPASSLSTADLTSYLDLVQYSFVNSTGGLYTAHQYTMNVFVSNGVFFDQINIGATFRDYLRLLGPTNCVANATAASVSPVHFCTIWVEIEHSQCQTSSGFQFVSLKGNTDQTAYGLNPSFCTGPITAGFYNGRLIDFLNDWNAFLQGICAPVGISGSSKQILLISQRFGALYADMDSSAIACSDLNIPAILRDKSYQGAPPVAQIYNMLGLSFNNMATEARLFDLKDSGGRPNYATTRLLPFDVSVNGSALNSYVTYQALTRGGTVVTYRVEPTIVQSSVTWQTWTDLPTCVDGICTGAGTLIDSGSYANILSRTVVGEGRLLNVDDVVYGELSSSMSQVYDVTRHGSSLDPSSNVRRNTVGYLRCDLPVGYDISTTNINPPQCNLADWVTQNNGLIFEHDMTASLSDYTRTVSGGICVPEIGVDDNVMCSLMSAFFIAPSTNMRQRGLLTLTPKNEILIVNVPILGKTIQLRAYAGCPSTGFTSDPQNVYVTLKNDFSVPLTVRICPTNADATCPVFACFTQELLGNQLFNYPLAQCGNYTAIVSAVDGSTGGFTQCGPAITIATDPRFQSPFIGSTSNNISLVTIANQAAIAAANVDIFTTSLTALAISYTIPGSYPDLTPAQRAGNASAALNAVLLGLVALQNGINTSSVNAAQMAIASSQALSAAIRDTIVLPAINASIAAIVANQVNLQMDVIIGAIIANQSLALGVSTAAAVAANDKLIKTLQDQQGIGGTFSILAFIELFIFLIIIGCLIYMCVKLAPGLFTPTPVSKGTGAKYSGVLVNESEVM
jgi:hypothetical protein